MSSSTASDLSKVRTSSRRGPASKQPAPQQVPVTVLTGFLGAGKTTVLNRILTEQHGHKIAVIENEFGPEGIDNELLVSAPGEQIVEMNNGCICCSVRGDLVRILEDLKSRRQAGELDFERVIIETTGMANPGPVAQTFFMDESVASYYLLDAVVTVVDAKHGHNTLDRQPEAQNQVGFADRILMSKIDLVTAADAQSLKQRLVQMNPRAPVTPVNFGTVPLDQVLDLRGFNLNAILEIDPDFLSDQHPDAEHQGHRHDDDTHPHDNHSSEHSHVENRHDDAIKAFVFKSERPFDPAKLEEYLACLTQVYGQDMLRYKGVLFMNGSNRRTVFQGVHMMMGADAGRPWDAREKPSSKIVFIGRNLPADVIVKGLEACVVR